MSCKSNKNCFNKRCGSWIYLKNAWVAASTSCRFGLNRSSSKRIIKGTNLDPLGSYSFSGTTILLSNYFDNSTVIAYKGATGKKLVVPYGYNKAVYISSSGTITEESVSAGQVITFKSNILVGNSPTEVWACDPGAGCVKIFGLIGGGNWLSSEVACQKQCCQESDGGYAIRSDSCDSNCASPEEICSRDCGKIPCGTGCCDPGDACCTDSNGQSICVAPDEGECCPGGGWCFNIAGKCCGEDCCKDFCIEGDFDTCCCDNQSDACLNGSCCPEDKVCGDTIKYCCGGSDICLNGSCCPTERVCDGKCCPEGQECVNGECCDSIQSCGEKCCPSGESCCGGDECCPSDKCCNGTCCSESETCVNGSCCPSERACNNINCCPEGETCCGGQFDSSCCPSNRVCCNGTCCPEGQSCSDGVCREESSSSGPYPSFLSKSKLVSW